MSKTIKIKTKQGPFTMDEVAAQFRAILDPIVDTIDGIRLAGGSVNAYTIYDNNPSKTKVEFHLVIKSKDVIERLINRVKEFTPDVEYHYYEHFLKEEDGYDNSLILKYGLLDLYKELNPQFADDVKILAI